MGPFRILAAATAMEICAATAILALAGLAGARNGWLDVINSFAPFLLFAALLGAGLGFVTLGGATRVVTIGLAALAVTYNAGLMAPELAAAWPSPPSPNEFRVLSANVWSFNPTPDRAVDSLLANDADAVLLQESDGSLAPQLERLHSRYPFSSRCPGAGVAIFTKAAIVAQGCLTGASPNSNIVWVQIRGPGNGLITLVTTHFGWPFPPAPQADERELLAREIHKLPIDDMILGGDFNSNRTC